MLTKENLAEIKKEAELYVDKSLTEIAEENSIKVIIKDLSNIGTGDISGAIFIGKKEDNTDETIIFIDSRKHKNRQRFTFAHELGHYFLHQDILNEKKSIVDKDDLYLFRDDIYINVPDDMKEIEEQANEFAGNLLMPKAKVLELWGKSKNIGLLAEAFDVSISAMSYRIYNLSLTDD
ncbi:MAG: ImmA/IrrE family metallo-endopeptidase [Candidatus Gracilibacteria bacterium]